MDVGSPCCLLYSLNEMRLKNEFCDGIVLTEDGGKFSIHKIILIASSSYFRVIYNSFFDTDECHEVSVPGVTFEMMRQIIDYCYLREAAITWNNVWELLTAANQLHVAGLINQCHEFLIENMTPQNCIRIRKFALHHNLVYLEENAHRYLMANCILIHYDDPDFLELTAEDLSGILSDPYLNLPEEYVWMTVASWINHQTEERKEAILELLRCVRLAFVSQNVLFDQILTNDLIMANEGCRLLILDRFRFLTELPLITQMQMITPPLACPRLPHQVMFLLGGCTGGIANNAIQAYDSKADMWKEVGEVDPLDRRAYHQCAVIDHEIYVLGGRNETDSIRRCRCFNVINKKWRDIAPLTTARTSLSVAVHNGCIYIMCGSDGERIYKSVEKYEPSINKWQSVAQTNAKRVRAAAATLGSYIYLAGGYNGDKYLKTMEGFDPNVDHWTNLSSMRQKRSELSLAAYRGYLYAVGGYNGSMILSSAEKYDPLADTWTFIPEMNSPRCQFSMAVLNDVLIVVGGFDKEESKTGKVERYDHDSNQWRSLGDNNDYFIASAHAVVAGIPNIGDFVLKDREKILNEKRLSLIQLKTKNDKSFIRALNLYNM